ncbi:MAG: hypothetical protein V7607_6008 [Solirubrobacteraceae bacterium]
MLSTGSGGMNGPPDGVSARSEVFRSAAPLVVGHYYLRMVIRRLTVRTLPTSSLAVTLTVTLPEWP